MPNPVRPTPGLMPKRKAIVPPSARPPGTPPSTAQYAVDPTIPRRGDPQAVVWPDTGVLLSVHALPDWPDSHHHYDMPDRFRVHYSKRIKLAARVAAEIRGLSSGTETSEQASRVRSAASTAYNQVLLGSSQLPTVDLTNEDGRKVEMVKAQLRALPGADQAPNKHNGEAEIIVLAEKAAAGGLRHIILANDAGASVVAKAHGLSSRHAADVIAELSCSDPALDADTCLRRFRLGNDVSRVPRRCAPADAAAFTCASDGSACLLCS